MAGIGDGEVLAVSPRQIFSSALELDAVCDSLESGLRVLVEALDRLDRERSSSFGISSQSPWYGDDELGRSFFLGQDGAPGFQRARDDLLGGTADLALALCGHADGMRQMARVYARAEEASVVGGLDPAFPLDEDDVSALRRRTALVEVVGAPAVAALAHRVPRWDLEWMFELFEVMVAGCTYPRGDERVYAQVANAVDRMAEIIDGVTRLSTRQVTQVAAENLGRGIDAFVESFRTLRSGRGNLVDAAQAYRGLAAYCRYFGAEIRSAKTAFEVGAVYTVVLWQVAKCLPKTLPSGVLAWLVAVEETERVGRTLRTMLTGVRARAATVGALLAGGQSLIGNASRAANGLPAAWTSVLQSAVFGGVGGRAFASADLVLARSAENGGALAGFLAHRVPGRFAVGTGVGFALNVGADVTFGHGHVAWAEDLGMAAGMAGVTSLGHVLPRPAGVRRGRELRDLSARAFGPDVAHDVTTLAGADHGRRMDALVRALAEENGRPGDLPGPATLREWTRAALGLTGGRPVTAYDVDSLSRSLEYYRQYHPDRVLSPGVGALHRFAETAVPGRVGGDAVRELGSLLRFHAMRDPGVPFDYIRHMRRDAQVRSLAQSVAGLGPEAEITARHVDGLLTRLFGARQVLDDVSPVDPRRTDLTILLDALDVLDRTEPGGRPQAGISLDDVHRVIHKYWDVPAGDVPTPEDAKALARLWPTNPARTLDPREAMRDLTRNLLRLADPPTAEQVRTAGHTLSLAIDVVGEDWPLVEKYVRPTETVVGLVRSEYGLPLDRPVDPQSVRSYAHDLLNDHGGAPEPRFEDGRTLMDAALTSDFYHLELEARNPVEHRAILGEVARLHELIRHTWPDASGVPMSFRLLEPVAERLTGNPDPYELLKLYRRVRADSADGSVASLGELARSAHARRGAFSDWSEFDTIEYARRNYVGERAAAHWRTPNGGEPGLWVPGLFRERIFAEDVRLINGLFRIFRRMGIEPGSFESVLDVGSGANLYPSAAMAAFVRPGGLITRLVYRENAHEIAYNTVMYDPGGDGVYRARDRYGIPQEIDTRAIWRNWEPVVRAAGAEHYPEHAELFRDADLQALDGSVVVIGDVFALGEDQRAQAVVEFYAGDSFSSDPEQAFAFRSKVIDAVLPGGVAVFGNVLNLPVARGGGAGHGYQAGDGTLFPNIAYDRGRWEAFLSTHPRVESFTIAEFRGDDQFSAGEEGLGLVVVKLKDAPGES